MLPDDITADWLGGVLGADIASLEQARIGDGLVGLNLRIAITYGDPSVVGTSSSTGAALPASVVIKLPSLDETSRATGVALRNYEREVKFYDTIADTVDIRVPHCHFGTWEESTGDFTLVLEDMAPADQGDQVRGCPVGQAETAVLELAKLHAPRWNDPLLDEHEFLQRRNGDDDTEQLVGLWAMFLPGFLATFEPHLSAQASALVTEFGDHLATWMGGRSGPVTVTHGDYRLDNLLFATPAGGPPVTAVDWQTPGHGPPVADLAYFCGAGLLPEERRLHEQDLLSGYADALGEYGVQVERDWLWEQYRREAFGGVVMSVIASQVVGSTARSEAMFAAMATRHLQACLDLDSLETVS
ncbi:MAG: phosphotransferase family protein [Ilumatobacter sp.]